MSNEGSKIFIEKSQQSFNEPLLLRTLANAVLSDDTGQPVFPLHAAWKTIGSNATHEVSSE